MANDESFINYVLDQLSEIKELNTKKLFGEIAIYLNDKIVAMICDNQFLVKSTEAGEKFIKDIIYAYPYPGAKACLLIKNEIEDKTFIRELLQITETALPARKIKKKKIKK